jgi:hypothetical protein
LDTNNSERHNLSPSTPEILSSKRTCCLPE